MESKPQPEQPDSERARQTQSDQTGPRPIKRLLTATSGLDSVLQGGLLQGGVYLLTGEPGSGKTILANQICYSQATSGGRAVYITLLIESHDRMLAHLSSLTFFAPEVVGSTLQYISGYSALREGGLQGLMALLQDTIRRQRPTLLVIDGIMRAEVAGGDDIEYKEFLTKLQTNVQLSNCTALMITPQGGNIHGLEHAAVDGIIEMRRLRVGLRTTRELEVLKLRGSFYLEGSHQFEISGAGVKVYPRTEASLASRDVEADEDRVTLAFGSPGVDEMLHGGVLSGAATMLLGPPGSGKTVLGMHFLSEGAQRDEQGLYFGFYETPPRLKSKGDNLGLHFGRFVANGLIRTTWRAPLECLLDALSEQLLEEVRRYRVKRLFIDGLDAFVHASIFPERVPSFVWALSNQLRAFGVTTIFSVETREIFGPTLSVPLTTVGGSADNIIFLRYFEMDSRLHRLVSILKVRDSDYDARIREFRITSHGIEVLSSLEGRQDLLTGLAHAVDIPLAERMPRNSTPYDTYADSKPGAYE